MGKRKTQGVKLSGLEANVVLYAFDFFFCDEYGKIDKNRERYGHALLGSTEKLQELRDKLFAAHQHSAE